MAEPDDVLWLHEHREISIVDLAECGGFSEAEVRELVEYGALSPSSMAAAELRFRADCLARLRAAARLRADLELELPALALVVSFLERIDALEAEVRNLAAQLQSPHR